jgi:uncharacterized protein (DUF427 family)
VEGCQKEKSTQEKDREEKEIARHEEVQLRTVPPGPAVEGLRQARDGDRRRRGQEPVASDNVESGSQSGKESFMSANSGPGYKQHPDHRITTERAGVHVKVTFKGELIADSRDAIRLKEGDYPAVYYIPRKDAKMDRLERTAHSTHCPFKGDASYFSLKNGPENAVWSYERPYDEMDVIKERLAFYPDKVQIAVTGEAEGQEKAGEKR